MKQLIAACSVAAAVVCSGTTTVWAQSPTHTMMMPKELTWTNMPTLPPGAMVAVIEGPLDQAMPFILRLRLPENYEIPAHWHPWIEHVTVISGTLHMGVGDRLDRTRTSALSAGGVAVIQSNVNHFSWTREETVVQVHGIGPLVINYVNPADDPRKK
jgi:hypothetical protein